MQKFFNALKDEIIALIFMGIVIWLIYILFFDLLMRAPKWTFLTGVTSTIVLYVIPTVIKIFQKKVENLKNKLTFKRILEEIYFLAFLCILFSWIFALVWDFAQGWSSPICPTDYQDCADNLYP